MKNTKKELTELIKNFNNACSNCGKLFLGASIEGSTEVGAYPVYVDIKSYPLGCKKCPDCAKKCYENLYTYVEQNEKLPCIDEVAEENDSINYFINEFKYELDCLPYLDEDYQMDQLAYDNPNVHGGELIDLFEFIKDEMEYMRKLEIIESTESIEKLNYYLEDKDLRIRLKIIRILGERDDPLALETLIQLLNNNDYKIREQVVTILGKNNDPRILQKVLELINDESYNVRSRLIEVFRQNEDSQIIKKLFILLKNENEDISKTIERILERNDSPEVIDKLIDMLKGENENDWEKALEIISKKGRKHKFLKSFNEMLNTLFDKFNFTETTPIKNFITILKLDAPTSLRWLIEKYKNPNNENKLRTLNFIGEISSENNIEQITNESEVYEELITILKNKDNDKKERILSMRILKNLISEINVMKVFVEILMDEEDEGELRENIEKILIDFISFNEINLKNFITYFIDLYDNLDNKQKSMMYDLLINFEYKIFKNKNFEKKKVL